MDTYTKHANVYPSIFAMLLPTLLTVYYFYVPLTAAVPLWSKAIRIFTLLIPIALVYGAIGFFMREVFRSTSKWLFQFSLYGKRGTEMPTTKMLMWSDDTIDRRTKQHIRELIKTRYDINLYGDEDEKKDPASASKAITNAIGVMRSRVKTDSILLQYNYRYGFARNYLGASVWAIIFLLVIGILATVLKLNNAWFAWVVIGVQVVLGFFFFLTLKPRAESYANRLLSMFQMPENK